MVEDAKRFIPICMYRDDQAHREKLEAAAAKVGLKPAQLVRQAVRGAVVGAPPVPREGSDE